VGFEFKIYSANSIEIFQLPKYQILNAGEFRSMDDQNHVRQSTTTIGHKKSLDDFDFDGRSLLFDKMTERSSNTTGRQHDNGGCRVICLLEDDGVPISIHLHKATANGSSSFSSLSQLEEYLSECIDDQMILQQHQLLMPLSYMPRADCSWLACQRPKRLPLQSVLGIVEELEEADDDENDDDDIATVDRKICFTAYHVSHQDESFTASSFHDDAACQYKVPHSDWNRVNFTSRENHSNDNSPTSSNAPPPLFVEWVDLRYYCGHNNKPPAGDTKSLRCCLPTTPASCTLFLRSLLHVQHSASPWGQQQQQQQQYYDDDDNKDVVILVINRDSGSSTESSSSTSTSCQPLLDYRVSDACPSWFLHAVVNAKNGTMPLPLSFYNQQHEQKEEIAMLLIYRRLPPRDRMSIRHPITNEVAMTGCLWETYYVYPTTALEEANNSNNDVTASDCSSSNNNYSNSEEKTEQQQAPESPHPPPEPLQLFRQVAPPYVNALVEYPGLLDPLLLPETMAILQQECLQISHWTAWPEQQHYKATKSTNASRAAGGDEAGGGGAPWNVFPLLYCFPSNQVENKTWIAPTCAVVPRTVQLLQEHLGDTLRTALYSRLDPGAVLEAHMGWQDLANHVLRVHLPLIVPNETQGLAGLWVDGCVECHAVGRVVCFDDSKTHRAFNYSNEYRIVLILDLLREPTGLPPGTAVGGHSEELDKFIEQMGTGSS
jgi:Aspartyl/Asparaginyl beta-hydroxylase